MKFVLYTYKPTYDPAHERECHAYGPTDGALFDDEQTAQNAGTAVAQNDGVEFMVLAVEGLPTI
jgi:hypothetical protein